MDDLTRELLGPPRRPTPPVQPPEPPEPDTPTVIAERCRQLDWALNGRRLTLVELIAQVDDDDEDQEVA